MKGSIISKETVTLVETDWQNNRQTVDCSGILVDEEKQLIIPVPASSDKQLYFESQIEADTQAEGSLTFKAATPPSSDIQVHIVKINLVSIIYNFLKKK